MKRSGEKLRFNRDRQTWTGRVTTTTADGRRDRGEGWVDLRSSDQGLAQKAYDRWLSSGEPPRRSDQETFGSAARRVVREQLAAKEISPKLAKDRLARLELYAVPVIGVNPVGSLAGHHVASVLGAMAKKHGKSKGYVLKVRSDLSQIFGPLVSEGAMAKNLAAGAELPKAAQVDTRPRMHLTDEQYLEFQRKRGLREPLDVMVMLVREVAGYRTSDLHAQDCKRLDTARFTWVEVRRPKTDGLVGARVAQHRARAYQLVTHEIPEHVRPALCAYHERLGSPKTGPLFPLLRPGAGGTVTLPDGSSYERRASGAGQAKGEGSSYAEALRRAVWGAGIYCPLPGWNPAAPDPKYCALQTDSDESRRLDFKSLRADFTSAVSEATDNPQLQLALSGHTQLSTQTRHYMTGKRVRVPDGALPGRARKAPETKEPDRLASLEAMMAELLARQSAPPSVPQVAPHLPQNGTVSALPMVRPRGGAPFDGAELPPPGTTGSAKHLISLASPRGVEPLTNALGRPSLAPKHSEPLTTSPLEGDAGSTETPLLPHSVGQDRQLLLAAAAAAVARGDWAFADRVRALLDGPCADGVARLDDARAKRRK